MVGAGATAQSKMRPNATNSSAYNTFGGAGAYATNTSQFSMLTERERYIKDLIQRGKEEIGRQQVAKARKEQREEKMRAARESKLVNKRELEEKKIEEEAIQAYQERQAKLQRIGSFKFDIDNDLDVEILTSDQVFEDLDDIVKIREKTGDPEGNNSAYKQILMNLHSRGKKKKKR